MSNLTFTERAARAVAVFGMLLGGLVLTPGRGFAFTVVGKVCPFQIGFTTSLTVAGDGAIYGVNSVGTPTDCGIKPGYIFKLTPHSQAGPNYTFADLYDFTGYPVPQGGVIFGPNGFDANLFGATEFGGSNTDLGNGTVYRLSNGVLTTLHSFTGSDGSFPRGRLAVDKEGRLFGITTQGGSNGNGNVFAVGQNGNLKTLASFPIGGTFEANGGLVVQNLDSNPILYGTTNSGGIGCPGFVPGCGGVFQVNTGPTMTSSILYSFSGPDGANPEGGLTQDGEGNLYGTTYAGGTCANAAFGTVFKLTVAGQLTTLYDFGADNGCSNIGGAFPIGDLARDPSGNLYGTTLYGGASNQGTVFKLSASGTLTTLHSFSGGVDGSSPQGVALNAAGTILFGATASGQIYELPTND